MIRCDIIKGRVGEHEPAYQITYKTPVSEGVERFGTRAKATLFAVEKLEELLTQDDN